MDGSAAVIGEMMLPILEPLDLAGALPHARDLGNAFQLTNFLRDVAEDLDRGRVYMPQEDLRRFGAETPSPSAGSTPELVELMRFEIDRSPRPLRLGRPRPRHAPAGARPAASRGARRSTAGILDRIEAADYDVFSGRASVPTWQKLAVAARMVRRS